MACSIAVLFSTMAPSLSNQAVLRPQLALIAIAISPSLIAIMSTFNTSLDRASWNPVLYLRRRGKGELKPTTHLISFTALEGLMNLQYRKEVQLFSMQDFVLQSWKQITHEMANENPLMYKWNWLKKFSSICGNDLVDVVFKIALAIRFLPQSITLASFSFYSERPSFICKGSANLLRTVARQFIESLEK